MPGHARVSPVEPLRILGVGASWPTFDASQLALEPAADAAAALHALEAMPADAVLLDGDLAAPSAHELAALIQRSVLVVVVRDADAEHASSWLRRGADDVLSRAEIEAPAGLRRVRFAIERRRVAEARVPAFSTDPGTGLPHRQQLVEHLSQLLALREREPSPMAVLALRIEGLGPREGSEAPAAEVEVLRRKIAVRLRAGVRASDVVASIDGEVFAVLLGSVLGADDAARVAGKLVEAVIAPLPVGGALRSVAAAVGIARYPQDGRDAERLLRRATALAAVAPATGHDGPAAACGPEGGARVAANDDR